MRGSLHVTRRTCKNVPSRRCPSFRLPNLFIAVYSLTSTAAAWTAGAATLRVVVIDPCKGPTDEYHHIISTSPVAEVVPHSATRVVRHTCHHSSTAWAGGAVQSGGTPAAPAVGSYGGGPCACDPRSPRDGPGTGGGTCTARHAHNAPSSERGSRCVGPATMNSKPELLEAQMGPARPTTCHQANLAAAGEEGTAFESTKAAG